VELPGVPRADHVLPVETAVAEGTAGVIAHAGDHPELTVDVRDGELRAARGDLLERVFREVVGTACVDPVSHMHPCRGYWSGLVIGLSGYRVIAVTSLDNPTT
jgi:hypothetical protein